LEISEARINELIPLVLQNTAEAHAHHEEQNPFGLISGGTGARSGRDLRGCVHDNN